MSKLSLAIEKVLKYHQEHTRGDKFTPNFLSKEIAKNPEVRQAFLDEYNEIRLT